MHNGSLYNLEYVVAFYNAGGTPDAFGTKSTEIKPLNLSQQEQANLVAFLESLSGTEILLDYPDLPDYEVIAPVSEVPQIASTLPTTSTAEPSQISAPANSGVEVTSSGLAISGLGTSADEDAVRQVIVQPGETLGDIAKREYGDVMRFLEISEANTTLINDPNSLIPGARLTLPEIE